MDSFEVLIDIGEFGDVATFSLESCSGVSLCNFVDVSSGCSDEFLLVSWI